jgi:hypothetical protein
LYGSTWESPNCSQMWLSISQSDHWDTRQDVHHHILVITRHHRMFGKHTCPSTWCYSPVL